jgi:hypothetical protein
MTIMKSPTCFGSQLVGPGIESQWRVRFSAPVQTGPCSPPSLLLISLPSSCESCQLLEFPLNVLGAQNRLWPAVGMLPLVSGLAYFGIAFPPFLKKQLYRSDLVVIVSFVGTGCATRKWGWLLSGIGYSITHNIYLLKGHVVVQLVEVLRYKTEDRGFDSRRFHSNFSLT